MKVGDKIVNRQYPEMHGIITHIDDEYVRYIDQEGIEQPIHKSNILDYEINDTKKIDILFKEICRRFPYGVQVRFRSDGIYYIGDVIEIKIHPATKDPYVVIDCDGRLTLERVDRVEIALRQLHNYSEDLYLGYHALCRSYSQSNGTIAYYDTPESIDFLLSLGIDTDHLIEKGLGYEVW